MNNNLNAELYSAVCRNDIEAAHALLKQGANPNDHIREAYEQASPEMLALLLENGGEVYETAIRLTTRSHMRRATAEEQAQLVAILLEHGADPNGSFYYEDRDYTTPLHDAAAEGNLTIAALLLKHGACINASDRKIGTPLQYSRNKEIACFLMDNGACVERVMEQPRENVNIFFDAFGERDHAYVCQLLEHGVSANAYCGSQGRRCLHQAAIHGDVEMARLLLERGADVHARDQLQRVPLLYAVMNRQPELIRLLLKHGANVNSRDHKGETPLLRALDDPETQTAQLLLEHLTTVQAQRPDLLRQARRDAARAGHPEAVAWLEEVERNSV